MSALPRGVMQTVMDTARNNGCGVENIPMGWWKHKNYERDFLLNGEEARIFWRTRTHSKNGESFSTQLNGDRVSWEGLSFIIIVHKEDIYVLPAEYVAQRAAESGSFFFNSMLEEVRPFKAPAGFKRLTEEDKTQSLWEAIQKGQKDRAPIGLVALQIPHRSQPLPVCGRAGCAVLLGRHVYADKALKLSCCSVDCLVIERKTRQ